MAELEIRTTGELIADHTVVGAITWKIPFIESSIAGLYAEESYNLNEFGKPYCADCCEKIDDIDDLNDEINDLEIAVDNLKERLYKLENILHSIGNMASQATSGDHAVAVFTCQKIRDSVRVALPAKAAKL